VHLLAALEPRTGVGQGDFGDLEVGVSGAGLGLSLVERRTGVGGVQAGDDLAGGDMLAFLDQHLDDLAGDLGRHRGLAPRDDVAGGVQQRTRLAGAGRGRHGGDRAHAHEIGSGDQKPGQSAGQRQDHQNRPCDQPKASTAAARRRPVLATVNLKLTQQRRPAHREPTTP
jgi:hypothetical protein